MLSPGQLADAMTRHRTELFTESKLFEIFDYAYLFHSYNMTKSSHSSFSEYFIQGGKARLCLCDSVSPRDASQPTTDDELLPVAYS